MNKIVEFYQIIRYTRVTMRCARTAAGIVRRGFTRVYFSPIFLRLWQLLITVT